MKCLTHSAVSLLILVLSLVILPRPAQANYSGGTGEPNNPYRIATPNDLNDIGNHIEDFNKCFIMTADINLAAYTGTQFNIIANVSPGFTGVFDGNEHTIVHFTWSNEGAGYVDSIGLFAMVGVNGLIQDVHMVDVNVFVGSSDFVAGLVGMNSGRVTNCSVTGTVVGSQRMGGLVGYNDGNIAGCCADVNVTGEWDVGGLVGTHYDSMIVECYERGSVWGEWGVGGLLGYNGNSVVNCYSAARVNGVSHLGGLIGEGGMASNSYWDVEVSGQPTSRGGVGKTTAEMKTADTYLGWNGCGEVVWTINMPNEYPRLAWENAEGEPLPLTSLADLLEGGGVQNDHYLVHDANELSLIGLFACERDKCFRLESDINLAELPGKAFNRIGPGYDYAFDGVFDGNGKMVRNLSWVSVDEFNIGLFGTVGPNGVVRNLGVTALDINATRHPIGGLCGTNRGTIVNCHTSGSMWAERYAGGLAGWNYGELKHCYSTCALTGQYDLGGLVGLNFGGSLNACFATGPVNGENNVGGLAGESFGGVIRQCASIGAISGTGQNAGGLVGLNSETGARIENSYATGSVSAGRYVGGLVGYNNATVTNCYATGTVSGDDYVGGLVGVGGTVTGSFWDVNTSGEPNSAGGTGLRTEQMQTQSTFTDAGWDFAGESVNGPNEVWTIKEGVDYPRHTWELVNLTGGWYEVDFADFAAMANWWGYDSCADANDCDGADFDFSGRIDEADVKIFSDYWLTGIE